MNLDQDQDSELSRIPTSTSFSIPSTTSYVFKTILGNKLDHLFKIITIPKGQKINETDLPIIDPYHVFSKKPVSIIRSIITLIRQFVCTVKEYVQASRFDQHSIPSTSREQFVNL